MNSMEYGWFEFQRLAVFSGHPVQGVPKKSDTTEIILLFLSTGFHAPGN